MLAASNHLLGHPVICFACSMSILGYWKQRLSFLVKKIKFQDSDWRAAGLRVIMGSTYSFSNVCSWPKTNSLFFRNCGFLSWDRINFQVCPFLSKNFVKFTNFVLTKVYFVVTIINFAVPTSNFVMTNFFCIIK